MKPNPGLADLETRVRLVRQISKEFPHQRGGGAVAWVAAFQAHPEYAKKLGADNQAGLNRLMAFARHVRLGGHKNVGISPVPAPTTLATAPNGEAPRGPRSGPKPEELELLKTLANKYPAKKPHSIAWKLVFRTEPNVLDSLGGDTPKLRARLSFINKRYLMGVVQKKSHKPKATRSDTSAQAAQQPEAPPIRCCPACGFLLEYVHKAYAATLKLTTPIHTA